MSNVYPDVGDYTRNTTVTIVGEGFVLSASTVLRVGNDRVCGAFANESCVATSVVFVDTFTLVAVIPPYPEQFVLSRLDKDQNDISRRASREASLVGDAGGGRRARRISVAVVLEVAFNGQDFTSSGCAFYLQRPLVIDRIYPVWAPLLGGTVITVTGRYFRNTRELACRFGDTLRATETSFVSTTACKCRTPSVKAHGRVSVEVSLDAQHWSRRASASVVKDNEEQITLLSPGLATSPCQPMPLDQGVTFPTYSGVYLQYYGVRIAYSCGSNAWSNLGHSVTTSSTAATSRASELRASASSLAASASSSTSFDLHDTVIAEPDACVKCATWPVEVDDLAGVEVLSFALGRTFGLAVASETFADTPRTFPAPGRLYSWGDNYVGQLGRGEDESERGGSRPSIVRACCRSVMTAQGTQACVKTLDQVG